MSTDTGDPVNINLFFSMPISILVVMVFYWDSSFWCFLQKAKFLPNAYSVWPSGQCGRKSREHLLMIRFNGFDNFITVIKNMRTEKARNAYSVQFSHSVVSDSLRPHESQHARPPCPSLTPGVHSDSGPSSQWCHPAISSSAVPFSSCPQSLPASESFPMSQLFTWGGQSTGVSALASFLPKKSQGWSPSE